jgi:uncharacterized membrane protein
MRSSLVAPILVILISVPLIFELIPRNRFYGFRVRWTFESDEIWYAANKVAGLLFALAGTIWLLAAMFLPPWPAHTFGLGLMIAAAILSLVSLSRMLSP